MKPLEYLNNVERAKLLHELFPREIPRFLEFTQSLCEVIREDKESITRSWQNVFLTAEMWIGLAEKTEGKISRYGKKLHTSSRLFADQLFDGYYALLMAHCLLQFTKVRRADDPKFAVAVELFFEFKP